MMDDRTTTQRASNQDTQSGNMGRYSWLEDYRSGNYDRLPESEITGHYRDWSRTASPDELYEATYHGYQRYPQDQLGGAAAHLYSTSQDQGLDLSDLNLSSPDYQQWNAEDMARVTGRAYGYSDVAPPAKRPAASQTESKEASRSESKPGGGGVAKPLIGLALAGALAFAASRVLGSKDDKDNKEESGKSTTAYSMPPAGTTGTADSLTTSSYGTGSSGTSNYTAGSTAGTTPAPLGRTSGTASMPSEVIAANEYVPGGTGAILDTTTDTPLSGSPYGDLTGNTMTGESASSRGSRSGGSSGTTGSSGGLGGSTGSGGVSSPS